MAFKGWLYPKTPRLTKKSRDRFLTNNKTIFDRQLLFDLKENAFLIARLVSQLKMKMVVFGIWTFFVPTMDHILLNPTREGKTENLPSWTNNCWRPKEKGNLKPCQLGLPTWIATHGPKKNWRPKKKGKFKNLTANHGPKKFEGPSKQENPKTWLPLMDPKKNWRHKEKGNSKPWTLTANNGPKDIEGQSKKG